MRERQSPDVIQSARKAATLVAAIAVVCLAPAIGRGQGKPSVPGEVLIVGRATDSVSGAPVRAASVEMTYLSTDSLRLFTTSDDSGRFSFFAPRRGNARLTIRRPGYEPFRRQVALTSDSVRVTIALRRIPQPLQPIVVEQSEMDLVLADMRRDLRSQNKTRIYDQRALEKSKQLLAGPFLLGQGGILRVPCQRSAMFLPEGKVRTEPVEHEPADLFWPCTMVQGKPVSVLVSVDNGPLGEFNAVSARQLEEFAMVVVSHNRLVRVYTKQYIENRARNRRLGHQ
jgi:hypothetical protein